MSVPAAYWGIVLIWSTTPLAIQWSIDGNSFAFAVFSRMAIGLVVATLLLWLARIPFPLHRRARRAYLSGGLGLYGAMALTYWGAGRVHSGLVSVLFGLSPLVAGGLARVFLDEPLTRRKGMGAALGLAGLAVIFLHSDDGGGEQAFHGLLALLLAVVVYSGSLVNLKRIGDDSPPLATTVGTLAVALPGFALTWWLVDGQWPSALSLRSGLAITYLGVFGSVIGFALYYYVIQHLEAAKVALITLITPVIALLLGYGLNGESVGLRIWLGVSLILIGLLIFQGLRWPRLAFSGR